jgi:hypothetical protein
MQTADLIVTSVQRGRLFGLHSHLMAANRECSIQFVPFSVTITELRISVWRRDQPGRITYRYPSPRVTWTLTSSGLCSFWDDRGTERASIKPQFYCGRFLSLESRFIGATARPLLPVTEFYLLLFYDNGRSNNSCPGQTFWMLSDVIDRIQAAAGSRLWIAQTGFRVRNEIETYCEPQRVMSCRIWGFDSGDYEQCSLLGFGVVWVHYKPTFRRNVSPPSSG